MVEIRVGTRWTARGSQAFARTRANTGWLVQHADAFRVVCSDPGGEKPDKAFDRHYFLATFEPVAVSQSEYDRHARERDPGVLHPLAVSSIRTALDVLAPKEGTATIADPVAHLRQALACLTELNRRFDPTPHDCVTEIETLKRERDKHDRRAAEWQAEVGKLRPQLEEAQRDLKIARDCNELRKAAVDISNEQIESLKRVRDSAQLGVAHLTKTCEVLMYQHEEVQRDLKIAREWNARHLATIASRPDAWAHGRVTRERDEAREALKVQVGVNAELVAENRKLRLDLEATQTRPLTVDLQRVQAEREALRDEVGSFRVALAETQQRCDEANLAREAQETVASLERLRASRSRELEAQVKTLKHDLALQVRARQEAQDQFVEEARRRKQGDDANPTIIQQRSFIDYQQQEILSLRGQCEALRDRLETSQPSHSRAVEQLAEARAVRLIAASEYVWDNGDDVAEETLRETVERLREILRPETALTAVERTRAEKAEYERGQFLAEVQRLTPQVTKMRGEIESLLRAKEIAENERDAARAHRRETESHLSEAPPRRMQRKVEEQRKALCALQVKCAVLVEKVAAQWARAERHASSERAQSAMWSARLATAEKERDRAHECIRQVKVSVAVFSRDPYGTLVSVRALTERFS